MEETYIPIKNKRKGLLNWAGWLNILSSIGFILLGGLLFFAEFATSIDEYYYVYEGMTPDMTYEEWYEMQVLMNDTLKYVFAVVLLAMAALLIFFGVKQLKYAKIHNDIEFGESKNLVFAILSLIFGNTISGILGIIAHNTKNNEIGAISISTVNTNSSAEEMQAKIRKLKEMYANGEITLEEYTNLMDKITF